MLVFNLIASEESLDVFIISTFSLQDLPSTAGDEEIKVEEPMVAKRHGIVLIFCSTLQRNYGDLIIMMSGVWDGVCIIVREIMRVLCSECQWKGLPIGRLSGHTCSSISNAVL